MVAATMLLTTLSLFHVVGRLPGPRPDAARSSTATPSPARPSCAATAISLLAIVAITALDILQRIFDTTALSFDQWCICIGIALSLLVVEELIKFVLRRRGSRSTSRPGDSCPSPPLA